MISYQDNIFAELTNNNSIYKFISPNEINYISPFGFILNLNYFFIIFIIAFYIQDLVEIYLIEGNFHQISRY